ncbi:MAG: 3',5'-nucleoside bisphosphate phosphatase [Betaproteobacteria bacterium]|jgi:predicted metal-dependent phosphoesterase TrpH
MSFRPDPWRCNADLHCHSSMSDGVLPPGDLVRRAAAQGVEIFSLTDHDEVCGQQEAAETAAALGMDYVGGVEISVSWGGETIHIVGLRIDWTDGALADGLARTRSGRDARAREIAVELGRAGIPDAWEGALRHVGNPALISRAHFARHIVDLGICEDVSEVFRKYLVAGKPGYVEHRWARLSEAIDWIRGAGGVAVLAHPGRYRLNDTALWALIGEFRAAGGQALEVVCGSHTRDQYKRFARVALEAGLFASRGADFHAPGERHTELGALPLLPDSVVPVWRDWPEYLSREAA